MEKGERRAPPPLPARRAVAPWLRDRKAHRTAFAGRPELPRGIALPPAVSPREAPLDSGPVGGKERPAPASLLPADDEGAQSAGRAAAGGADVRRGDETNHRGRTCLTGASRFADSSPG